MSQSEIPDIIESFITRHISSVAELEVCLLLHDDPKRQWTGSEIARELSVDPDWAERELADLHRRQIASITDDNPPLYHFASDAGRDALLTELRQIFSARRMAIVQLIFSKAE